MEFILFQIGETKEKTNKSTNEPTLALTRKGRKAVISSAMGLSKILPRKAKIQVWSSIDPEASETAELIAEELGVKRKFLRTIDSTDLSMVINTAFTTTNDHCIVIVGTNANIAEWTSSLIGCRLPLVPAACSSLAIDPEKQDQAELLWFFQPTSLKNII